MRIIGEESACPDCGSTQIITEWTCHHFPYGQSGVSVTLTARLPVRKCDDCGEQWIDYVGEDLMQAKIDDHIKGVLKEELNRDVTDASTNGVGS